MIFLSKYVAYTDIVLVGLLWILKLSQTNAQWSYCSNPGHIVYWTNYNHRALLATGDERLEGTFSLEQCKSSCLQRGACRSIEHEKGANSCRLSSLSRDDVDSSKFVESVAYDYHEWKCIDRLLVEQNELQNLYKEKYHRPSKYGANNKQPIMLRRKRELTTPPVPRQTTPPVIQTTPPPKPQTTPPAKTAPPTTLRVIGTTRPTIADTTKVPAKTTQTASTLTTTTTTTTTTPTTTTTTPTTTTSTTTTPTTTTSTTTTKAPTTVTKKATTTTKTSTTTTVTTTSTTTTPTTTTKAPDKPQKVGFKFPGNYTALVQGKVDEFIGNLKPAIAEASNVLRSARIESLKVTDGSVAVEYVQAPGTDGEISVDEAVSNMRKAVEAGNFSVPSPNDGSTMTADTASFHVFDDENDDRSNVTVSKVPTILDKLMNLEVEYYALIGLGFVIVLLVVTSMCIICCLSGRRDEEKKKRGKGENGTGDEEFPYKFERRI